jgi:hypothetical protein
MFVYMVNVFLSYAFWWWFRMCVVAVHHDLPRLAFAICGQQDFYWFCKLVWHNKLNWIKNRKTPYYDRAFLKNPEVMAVYKNVLVVFCVIATINLCLAKPKWIWQRDRWSRWWLGRRGKTIPAPWCWNGWNWKERQVSLFQRTSVRNLAHEAGQESHM